ncbi:glycosyltransferase family 2 protein [Cyclobacterium plantarum]|uniref:glycosyltransferase family 2 protein n=1 Tax=Cyclobacterium plantarum TaxID=2716263 RepID=UPI003F7278C5
MKALTLVIPVFNEAGNILRVWSEVNEYRKKSQYPIFTLFVDDGSTDEGLTLIKEICTHTEDFGFISFDSNRGLSAAIKAGFDHSKTKWVGYIDGDLQTIPQDFLKFEPFLNSFDLVTGQRSIRKDSIGKKLSSSIANWIRNAILNDDIKDSGCPLKIFNRSFFGKIAYFNGFHRFFPALVQIYGGKVKEIPVQHFPRIAGKSKFTILNRIAQPLMDLFLVYRLKQRRLTYLVKESQPLKNITYHE